MEDYGFDVARATLLETSGRLSEAAELHLLEGRPIRAIQLFMQDKEDVTSQQRAQECILDGLWQHLPISTVPTEGSEKAELVSLLKLADELLADPLIFVTPHVKDQVESFSHTLTYSSDPRNSPSLRCFRLSPSARLRICKNSVNVFYPYITMDALHFDALTIFFTENLSRSNQRIHRMLLHYFTAFSAMCANCNELLSNNSQRRIKHSDGYSAYTP